MIAFLNTFPPEFFELAGICGFLLYVLNYFLITVGRFHSSQMRFFVLNLVAASLVLLGLFHGFNLAAAMIQLFWIMISCVGIWPGRSDSAPWDVGRTAAPVVSWTLSAR